jgi:hypothetical protein
VEDPQFDAHAATALAEARPCHHARGGGYGARVRHNSQPQSEITQQGRRRRCPSASAHGENARRTLIFSFGKSVVVAALDFILGLRLQFVNAGTEPAIDVAFAALVHARLDALVIVTDPLFNSRPHQLVALAARYALPTIYPYREFAAAGG